MFKAHAQINLHARTLKFGPCRACLCTGKTKTFLNCYLLQLILIHQIVP